MNTHLTDCIRRTIHLLKGYDFKKIALAEHTRETVNSYYLFYGDLNVIINNKLSFHFGEEPSTGCSGHICYDGTDLGTQYYVAKNMLFQYLEGKINEEDIEKYVNNR